MSKPYSVFILRMLNGNPIRYYLVHPDGKKEYLPDVYTLAEARAVRDQKNQVPVGYHLMPSECPECWDVRGPDRRNNTHTIATVATIEEAQRILGVIADSRAAGVLEARSQMRQALGL